jgi:hypothetical protein
LQNPSQPLFAKSFNQKLAGLIEAMLADHPQRDSRVFRDVNHAPGNIQIHSDRLLHQKMLSRPCGQPKGFQPKLRKSAEIDIIDPGILTYLLEARHKLGPVLICEFPATLFVAIGADYQLEAQFLIRLGVLMCNCRGSNQSDLQERLLRSAGAHQNSIRSCLDVYFNRFFPKCKQIAEDYFGGSGAVGFSSPDNPNPCQAGSAFGFIAGMIAPDFRLQESSCTASFLAIEGWRATRLRVSETSSRRL